MTQQLILFDIDGTLLHGNGIGREATRRAMLEVFGRATGIDMHQFGGKTDWFTLHELLSAEGLSGGEVSARLARYEELIGRHMSDLVPDYEVVMLPGALDVLTVLRQRDAVLLGLVTGNVSTTAPVKLRAAGFRPGLVRRGSLWQRIDEPQ